MSDDKGVNERLRWRWDDGKMHDSPPPSSEVMTPAPMPERTQAVVPEHAEAPKRRPDVPADFVHTQRSMLRQTALDFALRSAALTGFGSIKGEELLMAAEEIERWIAQP